VVLGLVKAELARVWREREEASSRKDAAARGVTTAARERDKARAEKRVAHSEAREARDAIRKGWNNLVMLVEEERMAILKERKCMEIEIVEAMMTERERWEGRIRAAENRWEAAIAVAITVAGNAKLVQNRYKALCTAIAGDRERGEKGYMMQRPGP
jgi:hypothetical protein